MSECQQLIDCCPPTPFDYLILEQTFYNTQQCATVACVDGSHPTTECIGPGTYSSSESQASVDQQAWQAAYAAAQATLHATLACQVTNERQCAPIECLGGKILKDSAATESCVEPGFTYADTVGEANAIALAQAVSDAATKAASTAYCVWKNQAYSYTATCDPPSAGSYTVSVDAHDPRFDSTVSQQAANDAAFAYVQREATLNLICAASLDGLLWKIRCDNPFDHNDACSCPEKGITTGTISGATDKLYTIRFRIRGVFELGSYRSASGGPPTEVPGTNRFCVINSVPNHAYIPFTAANEYSLVIRDHTTGVVTTYYLNNNPDEALIEGQTHKVGTSSNYQFDVAVHGGSKIDLVWNTINEDPTHPNGLFRELNAYYQGDIVLDDDPSHPLFAKDTPPLITQPYSGQWMQLDIMSIT